MYAVKSDIGVAAEVLSARACAWVAGKLIAVSLSARVDRGATCNKVGCGVQVHREFRTKVGVTHNLTGHKNV